MITKNKDIKIDGEIHNVPVDIPEESDIPDFISMYEYWAKLSTLLSKYNCRRINLAEFSELYFCLVNDCWRVNSVKASGTHTSFDCYNPKTEKTIQVKSTSVESDLTSFGPKSVWDELYFMDFFCDGEYNGSFEIYHIPNDLIYNQKVNKTETFEDQQNAGKRPRFSIIDKIIKPNNIKPTAKYNIYDLKI